MNEIEFADRHLGEYKTITNHNGQELSFKYCPFCNGGTHHDQYTFSINIDKHTYNCLRGKCGERGTFKELAERYGEQADYYLEWLKENNKEYKPTVQYSQPKYRIEPLSEKVIKYFNNRGISKKTLERVGVKSFYFHKIKEEFAVFQFYENEKLVMNKMRLLRKPQLRKDGKKELKEWKEPGGKHVLWNMQNIDTTKPVVLCEGMIDGLSVIECGMDNVTSIPSGTRDLTWIDNCYEWIQKVDQWIIYVDNDVAGEELKNNLLMKFGYSKCKVVKHELKDANDELNVLGKQYILDVIENAKYEDIKGLVDVADVDIIDLSKLERCSSSIRVIDRYCGGLTFPNLTIWTGKRGSGKSTVASQCIAAAVDQGYNAFVYTGELAAGHFKLWLYSQMAGPENIDTITYKYTQTDMERPDDYIPKKQTINKIDSWIDGRMKIYDDSNTNEEDEILRLMEESYKRYNTRVYLIDNLMTVKFKPNSNGRFVAQSDFIDRLRQFALLYRVNVNVVVHPRKTQAGRQIDTDDIGGSGDIVNAAFNVYWISRIENDEELDLDDPVESKLIGCQSRIDIMKNRYYGTVNKTGGTKFDAKSKRFVPPSGWTYKFKWQGNQEYQQVEGDIPW
ncbi:hypothetical protein FDF74_11630 [Clostridium niameyense]|uniref:SF4 helicase domain-containing protein n=1 Tax=Clostridium niameyense TaxID=1622073 RepID=A0A6M0RCD6_9CLOT|nr:AAA family ATPase [Clostridium niameyense]NEZ47832.1 hypothetical protein [Clostridium niameyense]